MTPKTTWVPSVILARHPHGTSYYSALTLEEYREVALYILGEFSGVNEDRNRAGEYPSDAHCKDPVPPSIPQDVALALPPSAARDVAYAEWQSYEEKMEDAESAREDRESIRLALAKKDGRSAVELVRDMSLEWFEALRIVPLERPWVPKE